MADSLKRPPGNRRVGARVRIKPAHQAEVEALFAEARMAPIYKEMRADGNVSYWFDKNQARALHPVLERIPLDYWAHYAVIGLPTKH
jgi:hypothetical protein